MANNDGLSPPGSSTYDSASMFVGDGTWDADRNSFLLPNLQGLNFATMQYNGMGNRFRGLPQYHTLITGHGVMAAITFIGIVPAAIFIARFYHAGGKFAYKAHVYLQILTIFFTTIVFVLGWFAVGPERSLTNPHHGIGVAIYVCIWVQFLYGWWMSRRERKRAVPHPTIPLRVHIHRLFGRAVAILAFVQIGLGLTLYGSPRALFVVYALAGALLLFMYLTLEYRYKPRIGDGLAPSGARSDYYSDYSGSYLTGDQTELTQDRRSRRRQSGDKSHWATNALGAAGLFGAYKWWKSRQGKSEASEASEYEESMMDRRHRPPQTPGPPGSSTAPSHHGGHGTHNRPPLPAAYHGDGTPSRGSHMPRRHEENLLSPQSWENEDHGFDEKHGKHAERNNTWRDRILGAGAGIAAFQGVKSIFGSARRRKNADGSDMSYGPPLGGNQNMVTETDVSRVEAGQAPFSPQDVGRSHRRHHSDATPMTPSRLPGKVRPSASSMSFDDDTSYSAHPRPSSGAGPTLRDSIATMGAIAGFREWNKRRRDRNERQRLDRIRQDELEHEEQFNRRNSNHYPRPQDASGRRPSLSETLMTGPEQAVASNPQQSRQSFHPNINQPPLPATAGAIPSVEGPQPSSYAPDVMLQQQYQQQQQSYRLPPPPPGPPPAEAPRPAEYLPPAPGSLAMPQGAVNPSPSRLLQDQTQSSSYFRDGIAAGATGAALAAAQRTHSRSPTRRESRTGSRTRITGRRGSTASALPPPPGNIGFAGDTASPPVSLKMKMHPDGHHVTLRRLNEEEAAAERAARRREKKSRRASSLSSAEEGPSRYRRNGAMRDSSQQPIQNVPPPPPAMSNSVVGSHRPPSELNLPPISQVPQASESPHGMPSAPGPAGSGAIGSPGTGGGGTDLGTGTDVSAFDNNRRRRRAERARRLEASKGNKVEFS